MTTNTDNASGEIITHSLPSYSLEDVAELPLVNNDCGEDRSSTSNQTGGLFTKRNKIIVGSGIGGILLVAATGLSSASLTSNNKNVVVESFNEQFIANVASFSLIETYEFLPSLGKGRELGGGSIMNDKLLLVVNALESDSYLASVPILRNCKLSTRLQLQS